MTGMIHMATNTTFLAQKWKMVWLFLSLPWFKKRGPAHGAQYGLLALAPHCPLIPTCMCTDWGTAALLWRLPSSCAPVWKVCNWRKKEDKYGKTLMLYSVQKWQLRISQLMDSEQLWSGHWHNKKAQNKLFLFWFVDFNNKIMHKCYVVK